MSQQSGQGQPSWRGGDARPRRESRYGWKPGTGSRPTRRGWLTWFGLFAAAVVCLGGVAYLLFLLTRPPQPCFIAVAADPTADAESLDVPLDFAGWQSARRFLDRGKDWAGRTAWGRNSARIVTGPDSGPVRLPAGEAELSGWLEQFQKYDPIMIYFGVHCGTEPGPTGPEPVLYVGGHDRLPVRRLLAALANGPLREKRLVLLLDPGRLPPDPVYGHLTDVFPAALRSLDEEIRKCPHLVILSGCESGQRGWESEELRSTAFADAVIRAMDDPTGSTDVISASQLFDAAKELTDQWTRDNRPVPQTPVLLPAGPDGQDEQARLRAARIRIGIRPTASPATASPVSLDLPKDWKEHWERHAEFEARTPHPAAYTPRLWRRYCELLLRYERAVRAGETRCVDRLGVALQATEDDLRRPVLPVDPADLPQLQAFRALRDPTTPGVAKGLWDVASGRADVPPDAVRGEPGLRAAEWHLALMVQQFYRSVRSPPVPPPNDWKNALDVRSLADRAALGLPEPGQPLVRYGPHSAVFSERIWPFTRSSLSGADVRRRDAEDRLFSPDPTDHPTSRLDTLRSEYAAVAVTAADARSAFQIRDRILADLPFLGRWEVNRADATDPDVQAVVELWDRVHKLEELLSHQVGSTPPVTQAKDVWERFTALQTRFTKAVRDQLQATALQQEWSPKEGLLTTPLLRADQREQLLLASRTITMTLLSGATLKAGVQPRIALNPADAKAVVERRVQLARAELGTAVLAAHSLPGRAIPTDPQAQTVAEVAGCYRQLAQLSSDPAGLAEPWSRLSVPFDRDDHPDREPAAWNARLRWRDLLTDLADRAFTDHWYDENLTRGGKPYYHRAAARYLADADQFGGGTRTDRSEAVRSKLERVEPLSVRFSAGPGPVRWTSESHRSLRFDLTVPPGVPPGHGVVFREVSFPPDGPQPVKSVPDRSSPVRDLIEVKPIPGPLDLELRGNTDNEIQAKGMVKAQVYYRGQQPVDSRSLDVYRRPELVITDPGPTTDQASVSVRAAADRPPAAITILLDYSGSMKEGLNGFRLPGSDEAWKEGPSKFNLALQRLEAVLAELPKGTPLRIRLFSARGLTDEEAVVYPAPDEAAVADWRGTDGKRLKDLIAQLRRYEPYGETPLIQSIILSARSDFPAPEEGPKVLVVLTDGADDSGKVGIPPEERESLRKEMKNALTASGVKLFVVQFALNEADLKVSTELFADLPNLDTPGEVISVNDADGLRRELTNAIWPKLILTGSGNQRPSPNRYPATGWPSRPPVIPRGNTDLEGDIDPNVLLWSPQVPAGTYSARLSTSRFSQLPKVQLDPGDFLPLSVTREGKGFILQRELHADSFGRAIKKYRTDGEWVLSVPSSGVEDGLEPVQYGAVAMVERVPPHRRQPATAGPEPLIRHVLPDAMWWQVAPTGADPPGNDPPVGWGETKTVVTRLYGYPAPAWDLRVEGWPRDDRPASGFRPATVRVWMRTDAPGGKTFRIPKQLIPTDGGELEHQFDGRTFRLTVEKQTLEGSPERLDCLVVRTFYGDHEPVQLLLTRSGSGIATEHRYFRRANAYTAVFGPGAVPETGVEFRVIPVTALTSDSGSVIAVTPPGPGLGRRPDGYRPTPTGEAK